MSMKRRALSVLLTLAVMVTFMPFITLEANAASSSAVQVVTKAKANDGNTSYSYNKKGLITKAVTKTFSRDKSSDTAVTDTVVYKYNKKNKVSKKTETVVTKNTNYKTSPNTGAITASEGTVTTTRKYVTVYTYNKKGLATKSVETATVTKSGSEASSGESRAKSINAELTDGRVLAGYNSKRPDGSAGERKAQDAYYYTGAINDAINNSASTTTYVDNGNGTYTVAESSSYSNANYTTETMRDADGRITGVNVTIVGNAPKEYESSYSSEKTVEDKTVTTTTYKYDKKKRVKSAASTSVYTSKETTYKDDANSTWYADDGSKEISTSSDAQVNTEEYTNTTSGVITYTYDKKGHAKKTVYSNNGVKNSQTVAIEGLPNSTYSSTEYNASGAVTYSYKATTTGAGAANASVDTYVTANGTTTHTSVDNAYQKTTTSVYTDGTSETTTDTTTAKTETKTKAVKAEPYKYTTKYTYDKNGNLKSSKMSGTKAEERTQYNERFGNSLSEFDAMGELQTATAIVTHSVKTNKNYDNEVKKGTKRLSKYVEMTTGTYDREASSGYGLSGRVVYTLKAKKLKKALATAAEQQQWILQNGSLNGQVGLF